MFAQSGAGSSEHDGKTIPGPLDVLDPGDHAVGCGQVDLVDEELEVHFLLVRHRSPTLEREIDPTIVGSKCLFDSDRWDYSDGVHVSLLDSILIFCV